MDPSNAPKSDPPLMWNLGAFFGHIVQAIRDDPEKFEKSGPRPIEGRRQVQEARHGEYLLRRTTIDEVMLSHEQSPHTAADTPNTATTGVPPTQE